MIAVMFQSQNYNNVGNIPGYWPWKRIEITEDQSSHYRSNGWTVYSDTDFEAYIKEKTVPLDTYFINQISDRYAFLNTSIEDKIKFAQDLMGQLKFKNLNEGINAVQGFWMHQKVRAMPVTFYGMTFTIDLMNLVVSGDIELACLALMNTTPDAMNMPFHWLSQDRINWIVGKLKSYLGWP